MKAKGPIMAHFMMYFGAFHNMQGGYPVKQDDYFFQRSNILTLIFVES